MSIALYDADFVRYKEFIPYSYTLMKYAAYYKKKHEIVKLITNLDSARKYSQLIYSQDTLGDFDKRALNHPNVRFVGLRFDGGVWNPLPPEVERCMADTYIYPEDSIYPGWDSRKRVYKLQRSFNILASTNEVPVGEGQLRAIFFHDYNIFSTPNWKQRIEESLVNEGRKRMEVFSLKFPQHIPNEEAFLFFETIPLDAYFCTLRADIDILSPDVMMDYLTNPRNSLHSHLTFGVNIKENYTREELIKEFSDVYKWNFFAIKNNRSFLLYNKGICKNPQLDSFFDRLVEWNRTIPKRKLSFYDYINRTYRQNNDLYKNILIKNLFQQEKTIQEISKIDIKNLIAQGGDWPL